MLQGFLLGLASGTSCLAYCAPVFLPYLLSEGKPVKNSAGLLIQFLAGRLAGYLLFGGLAWYLAQWTHQSKPHAFLTGVAYAVLATLLMIYGFSAPKTQCAAEGAGRPLIRWARQFPALLPALMGLVTGLSLCPPFLIAITDASGKASLLASITFFGAFFIGTALFLVPLPVVGLFGRYSAARIVGRLASGITGLYYSYKGILIIYGGLIA